MGIQVACGQVGGMTGIPEGSGVTFQYEYYNADNGFEALTVSTGLRIPLKRR